MFYIVPLVQIKPGFLVFLTVSTLDRDVCTLLLRSPPMGQMYVIWEKKNEIN